MKKFLMVAIGVVGMVFSVNSFSQDKPVEIDGKHILVTEFKVGYQNKLPESPKLEESVFIYLASPNFSAYPNAKKVVENIFKEKGYKVSDKLEGSTYAVGLTFNGSLDIAAADKYAANSYIPNANQLAVHVGALANSVLSGGVNGIAGWAVAELFQTDSYSVMTGAIRKNPALVKGFFGEKIKGSDDEIYSGVARVSYRLEKGKEASDDVTLKMAVNEWIDHFMPIAKNDTQIAKSEPSKPTETPVANNAATATQTTETAQPQAQ